MRTLGRSAGAQHPLLQVSLWQSGGHPQTVSQDPPPLHSFANQLKAQLLMSPLRQPREAGVGGSQAGSASLDDAPRGPYEGTPLAARHGAVEQPKPTWRPPPLYGKLLLGGMGTLERSASFPQSYVVLGPKTDPSIDRFQTPVPSQHDYSGSLQKSNPASLDQDCLFLGHS